VQHCLVGSEMCIRDRSFAQLSIVVSSGEAEIVFGTDLDYVERARLAILIDQHFNGTEEIPRGV
jgi:hypothetical protein